MPMQASARRVLALTWAWTRKCDARLAVAAGIADIALRLTAKSLVGASGARDASSHARVGRDVAWLAGQRPQFATSAAVTTWAHRAVALTDEPCAVAVGAVVAHRHGRRALAAVSASGADLWHNCCLTAQIPSGTASITPRPRLAFGLVTIANDPKCACKGEVGCTVLRKGELGSRLGKEAGNPPAKRCRKSINDPAGLNED